MVGEVVPYDCDVGEEGIFKIVCSCRAFDMYSCGFLRDVVFSEGWR